MTELERLARDYREYARFEPAAHGSPIYAAVCAGLADDPAIGGIIGCWLDSASAGAA